MKPDQKKFTSTKAEIKWEIAKKRDDRESKNVANEKMKRKNDNIFCFKYKISSYYLDL